MEMRTRPIASAFVFLAACANGAAAPGNGSPAPAEPPRGAYESTAVTEDGAPRPLVPGTVIEVQLEDRSEGTVIRWDAGCNVFGATVSITPTRLHVGDISGTEMGCLGGRQDQDLWLNDFFASGPAWTLADDHLTLTSGGTVIRLVARDDTSA